MVQGATAALVGREQKSQFIILCDHLCELLFHYHVISGSKICFDSNPDSTLVRALVPMGRLLVQKV